MPQHVQGFTVWLLAGVGGYAKARPVVEQLAVCLIQVAEIRLYHFGLCILYAGRRQFVAHHVVKRGHGLNAVVVALYLVCPKHDPEKFLAVFGRVAQGFGYKFGRFVCTHGIAYRVVYTGVKHHLQRQAVMVCRNAAAFTVGFRCLVKQFHVPTVKRPHEERSGRSGALHLHGFRVAEIRTAQTACRCHQVQFFTPFCHRAGGYRFPALLLRHGIVQIGYRHIVEVVVVADKLHKHAFFYIVVHLCGVDILELLADETHIPIMQVFVKLTLQAAVAFRQGVRETVGQTWQGCRGLAPELRLVQARFALT
ncbi:hypothetical protein IMSAGC001_03955 [Bacteroides acidifaciens]|uniref:Uncharacterized protein n=1 Tax=Bacteroides acidifaciens TaxID=85831 RepID=A0A7J0A8R6_9BACE|nr:hypothetical protein IMSAGC001_03955 [Bacteroides acidifaciens]